MVTPPAVTQCGGGTELRWPEARAKYRVLLPNLTAAFFGFSVNFAILGDTFLGVFEVPDYEVRFWHFGLAILLGFVAAAISWMMGITLYALRRWVVPYPGNQVVRSTLGGLALGLIAAAVPLTLASGKGQLSFAIENIGELSAALLVAVVLAKILAMSIGLATGFIGGPVMPSLFIGGAAGLAIHALIPDIPITLAFSAMLVAVPGVSVGRHVEHGSARRAHRRRRCRQCLRDGSCGGNRLHGDRGDGLVRPALRPSGCRYR